MKELYTIKEYANMAGISEQAVRKNKKLKTIIFEEMTHVVVDKEEEEASPLADEIQQLKEKLKLERERKKVLKEKVNKFESKEAELLEKKEELKELKAELKEVREKLEKQRDTKEELYEKVIGHMTEQQTKLTYKG